MSKRDWDGVDVAISWTVIAVALAFVAACLVVLLMFWSEPARAGEYQREQLAELYAKAYGRAGIGVPEHAPKFYRVSRATLAEMVCHGVCNVRAAQFADSVFVAEDLDPTNAFDNSILVHEMVHYVQWVYRGMAVGCDEKRLREIQAFQIQATELERVGLSFPTPQLPPCTEPESAR